jgi:acetylornithine deacetylase
VIGEETGGDGMKAANSLGLRPHSIIFGEPTERKLVSGHKGVMHVTIHAKGRAAHSGYPWLGRSANEVLVAALAPIRTLGDDLPQSDKYGKTTLNIGKISGGVAGNVVAESALAEIVVRIAAGTPKEVLAAITKTVHRAVRPFLSGPEGGDESREYLRPEDVVEIAASDSAYGPVDLEHDVPGFDVIPVNYGTDVPNWKVSREGQRRYLYGPGTIFVAHSDHEALTEKELFDSVEGYERILLFALGNEAN